MKAAVILAAGAGKRYGGPKALAELDGRPFLEHVAGACVGGGCTRPVAVVAHDAREVAALALRLGLDTVVNADPERGMFSSVQMGLVSVLQETRVDAVVVFPVDHPRVLAATVRTLGSGCGREDWIVPLSRGRPGHPVVVGAGVARRLLALPPTQSLREALAEVRATRREVPVSDPGVLRNINVPEQP